MELLAYAAAEQADYYAEGDLQRAEEVETLHRLHAVLRDQMCPVTGSGALDQESVQQLVAALSPSRAARLRKAKCPAWVAS
jgi:hypothetical protein